MPALVNDIANELLPLIFRRRPRLSGTPPFNPDAESTLPMPNVLRRQPAPDPALGYSQDPAAPVMLPSGMNASQAAMPDETRPRIATPNITAPAPPAETPPLATDPVVSRSGQVMDQYSTRPARRVETDTRGRPTRNITMQGDDQTLDYADRVAKYEPREGGGGWWPKIRAALMGFAAGGPVGAGAAFGTRMLREKFQPKLADQEWKRQQMGEVGPAVEQIRKSRKDRLAERKTEVDIDLAKARTNELKNRKATEKWVVRQDENGVYRAVNQATGLDPDGKPVKGKLTPTSEWEIKVDQNNRYVPVNKRTGLDQNGRPVIARSPTGKAEEDVSFGNAQIQRAISEAQAEQAKIDNAMVGIPPTIEATDILTGTKKMAPNPEYTYNMTRRRQLDDQIRRWRTQLKAPKTKAATAEDPDVRAYADEFFGGDYGAAEAAAKRP